eukprot:tig00021719_g23150.t1
MKDHTMYLESEYERVCDVRCDAAEVAAYRREDVWVNDRRLAGLLPDRRDRILWFAERSPPPPAQGGRYASERVRHELVLDIPLGPVPAVGVTGFLITVEGALNLRDLNSLIVGVTDGNEFIGFQRGGTFNGVLGWVYSAHVSGDELVDVEDFSTYQPMDGYNDGVPEKFQIEIWLSDDVRVSGLARVGAFAAGVPTLGYTEVPVDLDRTRPFRLAAFTRADEEEYALGALSATVLLSRVDPNAAPGHEHEDVTASAYSSSNSHRDGLPPHATDPMMQPLHWIHQVGRAWVDEGEGGGETTARTGRGGSTGRTAPGYHDPFHDPSAYGGSNRTAPARAWRTRRKSSPRQRSPRQGSRAPAPRAPALPPGLPALPLPARARARARRRRKQQHRHAPQAPGAPPPSLPARTVHSAEEGRAGPRPLPRRRRELLQPEDERLQWLYHTIRNNPSPGPMYARPDGAFRVQPERRRAPADRLLKNERMGREDRFSGLAREYGLLAPNNGPGPAYNPDDAVVRPGAKAPKFATGDPTSRRAAFLAARAMREKAKRAAAAEVAARSGDEAGKEAGGHETLLVSDRPSDDPPRPPVRPASAPRARPAAGRGGGRGKGPKPAWAKPAPPGGEGAELEEDAGEGYGDENRDPEGRGGTRLVAERMGALQLAVDGARFPFSTGESRRGH